MVKTRSDIAGGCQCAAVEIDGARCRTTVGDVEGSPRIQRQGAAGIHGQGADWGDSIEGIDEAEIVSSHVDEAAIENMQRGIGRIVILADERLSCQIERAAVVDVEDAREGTIRH